MSYISTLPPKEDGFLRKKWSTAECRFLVDGGLLEPGKYELIEGEIISKMGQGRAHIVTVSKILGVLGAIFGAASVQSQAQIGIGEIDEDNDPEPDAAVLRGSLDDYLEREPNPSHDVLLVVEAANTTLQGDTSTKVRLYARHGIPEYWVVDITNRKLIVYREPEGESYSSVTHYSESDLLSPLAADGRIIAVDSMLPGK